MPKENFERMIKLAEEFFETKNDPAQLSINSEVIARLRQIHPSTLSEKNVRKGPVAWVLVIPTTLDLMEKFTTKKINEQDLLNNTPLGGKYDSLYLCSALVLPEYRGKGLAKRLTSDAIKSIRKTHPVKCLFYWAFSAEGEKLANSVARESHLPLYKREVD